MLNLKRVLFILLATVMVTFTNYDSKVTKAKVVTELERQGAKETLSSIYGDTTDAVLECLAEKMSEKYEMVSDMDKGIEDNTQEIINIATDCATSNLPSNL